MRISLVIANMGLGGSQYAMAWLAGALAARGHAVQLCTFDPPGQAPFFPLSPAVRLERLGLSGHSRNILHAAWANVRRLRALRRTVLAHRPDVVLSFIDQMNVLSLCALSGALPVVVSERVDPSRHQIGWLWAGLRRLTYALAKAIVVQTRETADFFPVRLRRRCVVIPNAVLPPEARGQAGPQEPRLPAPCVVGLGRLHAQKGFDLLLKAFARGKAAHPGWELRIFGEGPQRGELEALCASLGLDPAEVLPGAESRTASILSQAGIFVLSSRFEGFPNALCQAMAHGVPVIAADCPAGPGEIVRHGVDGLLVPPEDVPALALALEGLMGNGERRADLGRRGREILTRFHPDGVLAAWEALLQGAAAGRGAG